MLSNYFSVWLFNLVFILGFEWYFKAAKVVLFKNVESRWVIKFLSKTKIIFVHFYFILVSFGIILVWVFQSYYLLLFNNKKIITIWFCYQ